MKLGRDTCIAKGASTALQGEGDFAQGRGTTGSGRTVGALRIGIEIVTCTVGCARAGAKGLPTYIGTYNSTM